MNDPELAELFAQYELTFQKAKPCPRPDKLRYINESAACRAAISRSELYGHTLRAYHCVCDYWHLTSKVPKEERGESER